MTDAERVVQLEAELADVYDAAVLRGAIPTDLYGRRKPLLQLVSDALHDALTAKSASKNWSALYERKTARAEELEGALRALVSAVSAHLARGEDTTPGDFEKAWKQACEALKENR